MSLDSTNNTAVPRPDLADVSPPRRREPDMPSERPWRSPSAGSVSRILRQDRGFDRAHAGTGLPTRLFSTRHRPSVRTWILTGDDRALLLREASPVLLAPRVTRIEMQAAATHSREFFAMQGLHLRPPRVDSRKRVTGSGLPGCEKRTHRPSGRPIRRRLQLPRHPSRCTHLPRLSVGGPRSRTCRRPGS